jgi:MFS family permease
VDFGGFSDRAAGLTAGYGAIGSVTVALICALTMHHLRLRTLAMTGLLVAAIANTGAAFYYQQQEVFYLLRVVNAFSDGACYAAIMSCFARQRNSERSYGLFMMLQFGIAAVVLYALPTYLPEMNVTQMYLGFAFFNLLGLSLATLLPNTAALAEGISIRGSEWRLIFTIPALAGLLALCAFEASNVSTDAYIERIAVFAGLTDPEIGSSLGIASLMGVPGALAILWLGSRFGHARPVLLGVAVGAVSLTMTLQANDYRGFLFWLSVHSVTWAFTLPYIQSLLADMDPGGAVVTAGGLASGAGGGLGPSAAAMMVNSHDYSGVLLVGLAAYGFCALATLFAVRRVGVAGQHEEAGVEL